jgi:ATP-dependent exoDNAse (exonuclease V) alpha subunit
VYDADQRALAAGDLIRITRNEGNFKNGEVARVVGLKGDAATIEMRQGNEAARHEIDLSKNRHWDHAYASTVHASQGSTQHRAVFHIRAPEDASEFRQKQQLEAMTRVFGARSFYVGTTRASHELRVYTNSKAVATAAVAGKQDKTSAVETIERAQPPAKARQMPEMTR